MNLFLSGLVISSLRMLLRLSAISRLRWKKKEQMQNRHAGELQALVVAHARDKVRGRLHYVIVALSVCLLLCVYVYASVIVGFSLCLFLCVYVFASYSLRGCPSLFVSGAMSFFFLIVFALICPCCMRPNKGTDSQSP
jgi:hypothetical protein